MFGTPLAALDVILGIAGLDKVIGDLTRLDREMGKVERQRNPQGIQLTGAERLTASLRSQMGMWSAASTGAAGLERSLGRLQTALNAPTRDYGAALQAKKNIQAAADATRQLEAAQMRVNAARAADRAAAGDVRTARTDVNSNRSLVNTAKAGYDSLVAAEKQLQTAFSATEQAAKKEAAAVTALRNKEIADTNRLLAAERSLQKQRDEIKVREYRSQKPVLDNEFFNTVTGQRLLDRANDATATQAQRDAANKAIGENLHAREAAHQIALDTMQRQEVRYAASVTRISGELVATQNALAAQRATALTAIQTRNTAGQNLAVAQGATGQGLQNLTSAQAGLQAAQTALQTAQAVRQATQSNVQATLAAAQSLRTNLAPILQAGGAQAVAQFRSAMSGLNPAQYLQGVAGNVMGVLGSWFSAIGQLGKAGLGVLSIAGNAAFSVLGAGVSIVQGLGSAFMSLVGMVGGAGGALMKFLSTPLVATPLTGGLNLIVEHFQDIIKYAGLAGAAVVAFAAKEIVQSGMSYEASVSGIKGAAGYSPGLGNNPAGVANEMKRLEPLILQIGADTKYSNAEVASGVRDLLRGGLTSSQINDATIRTLFNVASATDSNVDDTTKVIDALVQLYKVPESEFTKAGDMVAGAVNSSLTDMPELGAALRQLGPQAQTMGIGYGDTLTALTQLAGSGFRGETGGTALRNLLIYLNPRSKPAEKELKDVGLIDEKGKNQFFDDKGNMKSMPEIFALLRNVSKGMNDEEQLQFFYKVFGTRSASAGQVMSGLDPAKWDQTKARISGQSAAETSATQLDNASGRVEILTGTLQSLASTFYMNWIASPLNKFLDSLQSKVELVYRFSTSTTNLTAGFKEMFGTQSRLGAFVGLIGDFVKAGNFSGSQNFVDGLREIFAMGDGSSRLFDLLPFIKNIEPWILRLSRGIQLGRDAFLTFRQALSGNWAGALTQQINPLVRLIGIFGTYWGNLYRNIADLVGGKIDLGTFIANVSGGFTRLLQEIGGNIDLTGPTIMAKIKEWGGYLKDTGVTWWNQHGKAEFDQLWTGVTTWFGEKRPMLVQEWNNLWNALLGTPAATPTSMPSFIPGLPGTKGMGYVPEYKADQPVGLDTIFGKILDKGGETFRTRIEPTLDILLDEVGKWWQKNGEKIASFGASVGAQIAGGIIAGIKGLIGPNWFQGILIGAGLPKDIVEKIFPSRADEDTKLIPGVMPGSTVRVPKDYKPGPDPIGGIVAGAGKLADIQAVVSSWLLGGGGNTRMFADPKENFFRDAGSKMQLPKAGGGDVTWDDELGRWVPKTPKPTANPANSALPIATTGQSTASIPIETLSQFADAIVKNLIIKLPAPEQTININGSGLTPHEFYVLMAQYLQTALGGGAPIATDAAGGPGFTQ